MSYSREDISIVDCLQLVQQLNIKSRDKSLAAIESPLVKFSASDIESKADAESSVVLRSFGKFDYKISQDTLILEQMKCQIYEKVHKSPMFGTWNSLFSNLLRLDDRQSQNQEAMQVLIDNGLIVTAMVHHHMLLHQVVGATKPVYLKMLLHARPPACVYEHFLPSESSFSSLLASALSNGDMQSVELLIDAGTEIANRSSEPVLLQEWARKGGVENEFYALLKLKNKTMRLNRVDVSMNYNAVYLFEKDENDALIQAAFQELMDKDWNQEQSFADKYTKRCNKLTAISDAAKHGKLKFLEVMLNRVLKHEPEFFEKSNNFFEHQISSFSRIVICLIKARKVELVDELISRYPLLLALIDYEKGRTIRTLAKEAGCEKEILELFHRKWKNMHFDVCSSDLTSTLYNLTAVEDEINLFLFQKLIEGPYHLSLQKHRMIASIAIQGSSKYLQLLLQADIRPYTQGDYTLEKIEKLRAVLTAEKTDALRMALEKGHIDCAELLN